MKCHILKIDKKWLDALDESEKKVEIRRNDRDFQKGDTISFDFMAKIYGETSEAKHNLDQMFLVTHVLHSVEGLSPDYVALSICKYSPKES